MPIPFLYSSILIGIFCTSLTFQDRPPSPLPSPACFFLSVGSVSQRKVASLNHIHLSKPQNHPRLHPSPERYHLPLASLDHIHLTKPQTYPRLPPTLKADVKKISRTDMRLRHSLSLAFRKKIKCIILIDKRIKTSAAVYGKYHTKGGFYHGIQTFWKHNLSSS